MGLRIANVSVHGDKLYFVPADIAAVIEYDVEKKETKMVVGMPDCDLREYVLGFVQCTENCIIVAPEKGNDFFAIDATTFEVVSKYKFDTERKLRYTCKFQGTFSNDKYVGYLGYGFSGVALFEKRTNQFITIEMDLEQYISEKAIRFFGKTCAIVKNKLYVPIYETKTVLVLDLDNLTYEIIEDFVGCELIGICEAKGDNLWLIPKDGAQLYCYNLQSKQITSEILLPNEFCKKNESWLANAFCYKDNLWLFPLISNMVLKVDENSLQITCVKRFDNYTKGVYTVAGIFDENHVWAFNIQNNKLEVFEIVSGEIYEIDIKGVQLSDEQKRKVFQSGRCTDKVVDLKEYIRYVNTYQEKENKKEQGCVGFKIWEGNS